MIINDLDGYYIVFDTKNWNTELDTLYIKSGIKPAKSSTPKKGIDRERNIVNMYNNNYTIDDIWKVSGFRSRSSVFRILNKYGVKLNRGKFSGPLGKRKPKDDIENEIENE